MPAEIADGVQITVSIGFSTAAGDNTVPIGSTLSSITYTDVSTYVRSVQTKRGRSSELDDFTTGSCQVIFSNEDRRFDPENTVGPYYGKITPGRPILVQATAPGGSAETIFQGYVDQWDQQYTNPSDAVAVVTASDAFKVLNLITLPSYWEYQIRQDAPTSWFRFDDGDAPTKPFETISGRSFGTWTTSAGVATTGASTGSLIANDSSVSAQFDGTDYIQMPENYFNHSSIGPGSSRYRTIEFWFSTTTTTPGTYGIANGFFMQWGVGFTVNGSGIGFLRAYWNDTSIGIFPTMFNPTIQINDGKPHHVVMVWNDTGLIHNGTLKAKGVYLDGVFFGDGDASESFPTFTTTDPKPGVFNAIGATFSPFTATADNYANYFTGTLDELNFYANNILNETQVAAHYAIGKGTYLTGNTTTQRLESLLAMADWMSDGETFSTATSTVQGIDTQNDTLLSALKECETADQGRLFCDRSGLVKFISHNEMAVNSTFNTSQRTFGDGTGELPYLDLEFTYNDHLIFNRSNVARREGATAVIDDTTSQGQYFIRTDSQSGLINDTNEQVDDIARVRVATYKQPQLRIDQMRFSPRRLPSMYAATITDDIGTRITVKRRPQGVGSVISKELIVEGISHDIGISSWVTTYNLSPAPLAFLILDNLVYGVIDSTNVLGY